MLRGFPRIRADVGLFQIIIGLEGLEDTCGDVGFADDHVGGFGGEGVFREDDVDVFGFDEADDGDGLGDGGAFAGEFFDGGDLVEAVTAGEVVVGGVEADEVFLLEGGGGGGEVLVEGLELGEVGGGALLVGVGVGGVDFDEGVADGGGGHGLDAGVEPDVGVAGGVVFGVGLAVFGVGEGGFCGVEGLDAVLGDEVADVEGDGAGGVGGEFDHPFVDVEAVGDEELGAGGGGAVFDGGFVVVGAGRRGGGG